LTAWFDYDKWLILIKNRNIPFFHFCAAVQPGLHRSQMWSSSVTAHWVTVQQQSSRCNESAYGLPLGCSQFSDRDLHVRTKDTDSSIQRDQFSDTFFSAWKRSTKLVPLPPIWCLYTQEITLIQWLTKDTVFVLCWVVIYCAWQNWKLYRHPQRVVTSPKPATHLTRSDLSSVPCGNNKLNCRWCIFWYNSQQRSQSACDRCDWVSFMKSLVPYSQDLEYCYCFAISVWQLCRQFPCVSLQQWGTHGWGHIQSPKLGTFGFVLREKGVRGSIVGWGTML
jgi:hypothetical protein